jgi:hypothetical protein
MRECNLRWSPSPEAFQPDAQEITKEIVVTNNGQHYKYSSREYKTIGWCAPCFCLLPEILPCAIPRSLPDKISVGDKLPCLLPLKMKVRKYQIFNANEIETRD